MAASSRHCYLTVRNMATALDSPLDGQAISPITVLLSICYGNVSTINLPPEAECCQTQTRNINRVFCSALDDSAGTALPRHKYIRALDKSLLECWCSSQNAKEEEAKPQGMLSRAIACRLSMSPSHAFQCQSIASSRSVLDFGSWLGLVSPSCYPYVVPVARAS